MKEASWGDCISTSAAKKVSPNGARAQSLVETANARTSLVAEVTDKNCNFVFEDYYTSLLELLQALVIKQGYNVTNHICLGFYIRDMLHEVELFLQFDDVRYKRNSLTYYGNRMDVATAKQAIEKCKKIISKVKELLK